MRYIIDKSPRQVLGSLVSRGRAAPREELRIDVSPRRGHPVPLAYDANVTNTVAAFSPIRCGFQLQEMGTS